MSTFVFAREYFELFSQMKDFVCTGRKGRYNINARLGYQGGKGQNNIIGNLDLKLVPSFSLYQSLENWQFGNSKEDLLRKQL